MAYGGVDNLRAILSPESANKRSGGDVYPGLNIAAFDIPAKSR
jgi:hypothetical protein